MRLEALACGMWVMVCVSSSSAGGSDPFKPRATLELQVADLVSGSSRQGTFDVILRNEGSWPIWVNGRMSERSPGHPDLRFGHAELALEIVGPSGQATYECGGKESILTVKDYSVLKPGEEIVRKRSLFCFEGLDVPGSYKARARYQDRNPQPPVAPVGTRHLTQEIVSATIQFEVIQTDAGAAPGVP